jgi:hypothetical protein
MASFKTLNLSEATRFIKVLPRKRSLSDSQRWKRPETVPMSLAIRQIYVVIA